MSKSAPRTVRCAIIGTGPAGWTAAIYAARGLLAPVIFTGPQDGGQLTITTDVENYPGFAEVIQGPWLMDQMRAQAEHMGTRVITDTVTGLEMTSQPFKLTLEVVWGDHGALRLNTKVLSSDDLASTQPLTLPLAARSTRFQNGARVLR